MLPAPWSEWHQDPVFTANFLIHTSSKKRYKVGKVWCPHHPSRGFCWWIQRPDTFSLASQRENSTHPTGRSPWGLCSDRPSCLLMYLSLLVPDAAGRAGTPGTHLSLLWAPGSGVQGRQALWRWCCKGKNRDLGARNRTPNPKSLKQKVKKRGIRGEGVATWDIIFIFRYQKDPWKWRKENASILTTMLGNECQRWSGIWGKWWEQLWLNSVLNKKVNRKA